MMALGQVDNQLRPGRQRDKVYGKRRIVPSTTRDAHLDLFGGDKENELEQVLTKLSLTDAESIKAPSEENVHVIVRAEKSQPTQSSIPRQDQEQVPSTPAPIKKNYKRNDAENKSQSTKPTSKRRAAEKRAALSRAQTAELKDVLTFPWISPTPRHFEAYCSQLSGKFNISKLGEGSYSDCFLIQESHRAEPVAVLKIIPIESSDTVTSGGGSHSHDFLREIKVLAALEPYHGFAQIRTSCIAVGQMNHTFVEAVRDWSPDNTDDTDRRLEPLRSVDNLYGIIEMAFAGRDLELLAKPSAFQAFDAFWKTAILIANAETKIQFEHRDLHMSNICFKSNQEGANDVSEDVVTNMKKAPEALLGLSGLEVNIIDYTHSRMTDCVNGDVLFNPDSPFTAEELEVYGEGRQPCDQIDTVIKAEQCMSRKLEQYADQPKYQAFTPKTNVIWLSHVLHELTKNARSGKRWSYRPHSSNIAKKVQRTIWTSLGEVLECIGSSELDTLPDSAEEFLHTAVDLGWIGKADVDNYTLELNGDSIIS